MRHNNDSKNAASMKVANNHLGTRLPLIFLEASVPLTKTFTKTREGLVKTPYPMTWEFTSHVEQPSTLSDFTNLLRHHASQGHCLLKGNISKPLVKESRAGSTDTNAATDWIVLDFDGLPETLPDLDTVLGLLGLADYSYIVQWSASYGIENKRLRAHVFMQLDKPHSAPLLKQWLIHLNHSVAALRASMTLTKTGNSISWPLDISACQNDKLIYIAPPILKGLKDPFQGKQRINLVKRKYDKLSISGMFSTEKNRDLTNKRIGELREQDGLPKRKMTYKMHGSNEILIKPDACTISDMKQERGFVYFNLNGGDSWAYYHPENNPEFIFNFKGEPTYLTKELLPDYWQQLTSQSVRTGSNGVSYLAFCDRATSAYWRGTYDAANDELALFQAKNETQLRHFAKQYGMPLGDFIPEWDITFDPHSTSRVAFNERVVNMFSPTEYMQKKSVKRADIPPVTKKVIEHALGNHQPTIDHFLNWLAFILQRKDRTKTAWILHGVPGTGKGILMNNILRPILGQAHTAARRMEELNEPYNQFMRNSLLIYVDEVQTKALENERGVMAKLKNFITEEFVPIRAMHANAMEARNYTNWIFASNMPDPVYIDMNDRRFNVGAYQRFKLEISDEEIAAIPDELQAFHDYLALYALDTDKAMTVLDSADRATMISISESSVDQVSRAMLEGDFDFLMDQLPAGQNFQTDWRYLERLDTFKAVLRMLIERTDTHTRKVSVAREELRFIYDFVVGNMPNTPNKFTSLLKHHRIHIEKVWLDNRAVSGIKVTWDDTSTFKQHLQALSAQPVQPGNVQTPTTKPSSSSGTSAVVLSMAARMRRKKQP